MSIIRDFIEYYRMPAEIKIHLTDFEVKNTLLNGYEKKYYYALDGFNHYTMLVDMFTSDDVRYRRVFTTFDINFNILTIVHEYEYGKKSRTDTFVYGTGILDGAIIQVDTVKTDVDITWSTPSVSTGWPYYGFGKVDSIGAGDNITVDDTDIKNPIINASVPSFSDIPQSQALSDSTTIISPNTLGQAFKGSNQSLLSSGYQNLPGGLIIQWGSFAVIDTITRYTITLPIEFPNSIIFSGSIIGIGDDSSYPTSQGIYSYTSTQVIFNVGLPSGSCTVTYMVIGY